MDTGSVLLVGVLLIVAGVAVAVLVRRSARGDGRADEKDGRQASREPRIPRQQRRRRDPPDGPPPDGLPPQPGPPPQEQLPP